MPLDGYRIIKDQEFAQQVIKRVEAVDPSTEQGKARHLAGIESMKTWIKQAEQAVQTGKFPPSRPATAQVGIGTSHQDPTRLYRGMIHPLVPYAIRGAIWYKGNRTGMKAKPTTTRSTDWSKAGARFGTRETFLFIGFSWPTSPMIRRPRKVETDMLKSGIRKGWRSTYRIPGWRS